MNPVRRSLLAAPLWLGLCGFSSQPLPPQWNGGHPESLDPVWSLLSGTQVARDKATGSLAATFSPDLLHSLGQPFQVEGFMLPLEMGRQTAHFALTRRNSACPFCPPNGPTDVVEVLMESPLRVSGELLTIRGQLVLHASSDEGMFFQLRRAQTV